ncbi:MAG: hypothetical protein B7X45_13150 [Lysobacterales bacterium 15-68-25]|jgi:hypothetical protein|nr:MAG: hypothetical protein B7X45_13150 [Xanthomonadales bacterium 15-68-25]
MKERLFLRWKLMFVAVALLLPIPFVFRWAVPPARAVTDDFQIGFLLLAVYSLWLLVRRWKLLTWFERLLVTLTIPALLVEAIFADEFHLLVSLPGVVLGGLLLLTMLRTPYVVKGKAYRIRDGRDFYESEAMKATIDRTKGVVFIQRRASSITAPIGKLSVSRKRDKSTLIYDYKEADEFIQSPVTDITGRVQGTTKSVFKPTYGQAYRTDGGTVERFGTSLVLKGRTMTAVKTTDYGRSDWFMRNVDVPGSDVSFGLSDPDDTRFARWVKRHRKCFSEPKYLKDIANA